MINIEKLKQVIEAYKADFSEHFEEERYKWEAVKCFQDNWNIDTPDFAEMIKNSLAKTGNLLGSMNYFPRRMIVGFARDDSEATMFAFKLLFDESRDLRDRIESFITFAEDRKENHNPNNWKSHYQDCRSISAYLCLMYPTKYYFYKQSLYIAAKDLMIFEQPKGFKPIDKLLKYYEMCDEICEYIKRDKELVNLMRDSLNYNEYSDEKLHLLVQDILYSYNSKTEPIQKSKKLFHLPEEYTPGLSVDDWKNLINDKSVFDENSIALINGIYDNGGQATCSELAEKYGDNPMHYSGIATGLAKRIARITGCPTDKSKKGEERFWTIPFTAKQAAKNQPGVWVWQLRDELKKAFELVNDKAAFEPVIWKISHGTPRTSGMDETMREEFEKRRITVVNRYTLPLASQKISQGESYMNEIKEGDYFYLCYAGEIVLFGQFESKAPQMNQEMFDKWQNDDFYERKYKLIAKSQDRTKYNGKKKLWTSNYNSTCVKVDNNALFEELILQPFFGLKLTDLNNAENHEAYTKKDFLNQVYITEKQYDTLAALLKHKKNIILQGAPGVGKTFTAKRLAYSLMGEKDDSRIEFIQFHQSYSYEDFIMGYRPTEDGSFKLKDGVFYRFCEKARNDTDRDYYFIIDEINRGNLSKIFGEMLMLIEADKRGDKLKLTYQKEDDEPFSIPDNVYIIGMMNTADRSLAMIDYALRRRFSFFEMEPGFDSDGFKTYSATLSNELFDALIGQIKLLNKDIEKDSSLGKGFCVGHSYFCNLTADTCTDERLHAIVEYDIIPILSEYWFDDKDKVEKWSANLRGIFNDD